MMNEQAQGQCVHPLALGEGKRFANGTAQALTQRVVPSFDMASLARAFAGAAVGAPGEYFVVGQPIVAAGRPAAVRGRDALTQSAGTFCRAVPDETGHDLAGLSAEGDPHPAGVRLRASETPKLIEFEHVARLGRQSVSLRGGRASAFFRATWRSCHAPRRKHAGPPAGSGVRWPRRAALPPCARAPSPGSWA